MLGNAKGHCMEPASEVTDIHTGILRLALGIEESRSYWEHAGPSVLVAEPGSPAPSSPAPGSPDRARSRESADRALLAFEQRWFGSKSLGRVRYLLANLSNRYDVYPQALGVLQKWRSMEAAERRVLCHFHLQLSDPIYRLFTGKFLVERSALRDPNVDRDVTLRWVKNEFPSRWSEATCVQFASKLLSACSAAGLISKGRGPRSVHRPKVPDLALAYWLYLLRGLRFEGTLTDNPYFASVGLVGGLLDQRLKALPGISFRRMGQLTEFEWQAPTLSAWGEGLL